MSQLADGTFEIDYECLTEILLLHFCDEDDATE